jgi:hypothetical protein
VRTQEAGKGTKLLSISSKAQLCVVAAIVASALGGCQLPGSGSDTVAVVNAEREAVRMAHRDAERFRSGMQAYLASLHTITDALSKNDWASVATGATASGMSAVNDVSLAEALTMPPQFVLLAADTHERFDALAAAASAGSTRSDLLTQLSDIVANCTACHAAYRLELR